VRTTPKLRRDGMTQGLALASLLVMGGLALVGPSGILAWSENSSLLVERERDILRLSGQRDELRNRVNLLDPGQADADLAGELLRSNLNVVHPDEMVLLVD
jgi:cell division protein FtsB